MKILGKELTFNGNKVYHAGNKPTASEIGAAASSHTHNYAGSSSAGGNANAAVKLATARTINGTSFDGSANITTANWGTARNIQIGNTAKSVNGSANVTWSLSEIGAAAASHGRHIPDTCETITDWNNATKNGWYMGNNATNSPTANAWYFGEVIAHNANYVVQTVYQFTASTDAKAIPKYIRAKMNGTWGAWTNVTVSKAVPSNAVFTDTNTWRGVQDNLTSTATDQSLSANQGKVLKGLIDGKAASSHTHNYAGSSSAGGAANSATKLATARSINGTNFDGTGNITTANWGTARNLNGVSVNGSTNYIIPVENYYCNVGDNNTNLYHRILTTDIATANWVDKSLIIVMHSGYNGGGFGIAKITFRTNDISSEANSQGEIKWLVRNGFAANALVFNFVNQAKNACMDVFYKSPGTYAGMTWYVLSEGGRGGAHSKQWTKYNTNASGTNAYTEANMKTLRTYTSTLVSATDAGHVSTANSANTLATARTINGTSFNGSGNITTANWGTARNLQIGNTAKSVNGSANVTWTLSEIGAAASNHTHSYLPLSGGTLTGNINFNMHGRNSTVLNIFGGDANGHQVRLGGGAATIVGAGESGAALESIVGTAEALTLSSDQQIDFYTNCNTIDNRVKATLNNNLHFFPSVNATGSIGTSSNKWNTMYANTFYGALNGNASTATKLQTARTINGTSFDGSANITTANWGTARNIQIGNTAKSVNGSANVTWSLSEIGAAASSHTHSYLPLSGGTVTGSTVFQQGTRVHKGTGTNGSSGYVKIAQLKITGNYQNQPIYFLVSQRGRDLSTLEVYFSNTNGPDPVLSKFYKTGGVVAYLHKSATSVWDLYIQKSEGYDEIDILDFKKGSYMNGVTVTWTNVHADAAPTGATVASAKTESVNISGNAGTATRLQTARTINGTSFDGSGNITTANWGTARTITIGKTAKSVNGSANVSWTAAEIGVASIDDSTTATGTVWSSNKTQVQINTSYNTMSQKVDALEESINRDFVSKNGSTMTGDLTIKKSNGAAAKLNVHRTINSNDMQGTIDIYSHNGGSVALSTNNKTSGKQTSSYVFGGDAFWSPRNADSVIPDIGTSSYRFKKAWLTDIDVTGVSNLKGTIYGKNNIALDRGSLWLQGAGGNLTCDFLRFGTSIMASSDSKMIYFIDTAGNRATVDCGDLRAVNLKLTNAGYPAIKFSDNVRIEYDVNGDALYAAGTKSTSSGLREFRATQCNSTVNAIIAGKRLFIQSGTPSGVATGDVWIQI